MQSCVYVCVVCACVVYACVVYVCVVCACIVYACVAHAGCLCHARGATDLDCHPITGQCSCQPNVRGLACDECMVSVILGLMTTFEKCPSCVFSAGNWL